MKINIYNRIAGLLIAASIFMILLPSTLTDISRITANTKHYGPALVQGQPVTIYSHGLMCNKWIGGINHCESIVRSPYAFIQGPMISFSYRDWLSPLSTCVGQEDDLEQLDGVCKNHTNIILVGCSRGAATIINYLGIYKPTNIIGAVIESPFDHTRNVINYLADQMNIQKRSLIDAISKKLAPNHNQDGIQPIDHVTNIAHEIPLLFICTTKDRIIPLESCLTLYKELKAANHPRVHLLIADHGAHGLITFSSDGMMMRDVIHAFYKQYGLPHDAQWASDGHERFMQCQPSIETLEKLYAPKEAHK